jgi:oligoribonuclease
MPVSANNLVWIDLEMTGLDVNTQTIIEIAVVITDENLKELNRWPNGNSGQAIFQPDQVLAQADEWVRNNMAPLFARVKSSNVTLAMAEDQVLALVSQYCPPGPGKSGCPLAGNSVGQDRVFLNKYMPKLAKYLSYRTVDASTIKELVKRWGPASAHFDKKQWLAQNFPGGKHDAMVDVLASIAELQYYRANAFR